MQGELTDFEGETNRAQRVLWQAVIGGGESRTGQYTGTKALMLAVLEDAMRGYLSSGRSARAEAEYWMAARRLRSPFSFTVVCETLGLEPDAVIVALQRLRERNTSARKVIRRSRPNVRRAGKIVVRNRN